MYSHPTLIAWHAMMPSHVIHEMQKFCQGYTDSAGAQRTHRLVELRLRIENAVKPDSNANREYQKSRSNLVACTVNCRHSRSSISARLRSPVRVKM